MEISKYALFADVAETHNFTKSGDRLGYTQPGVSHTLKSLETELGFALFRRTRNGAFLTPAGRQLLPIVRQLLAVNEHLEETISSLNGLTTGHITIACFASISRNWLPQIIYRFRQDYPGIEIELLEGGTDDIVGWVEDHAADFGLLSRRHTSSLNWIQLREDPLMAILPNEPRYAALESYPVAEMAKQPFILSAEGTDYDIHHLLDRTKIRPDIRFTSKDDHAIVSMVANHLGISILPKLVIEDADYDFVAKPLSPYFKRDLGIAYLDGNALSPAAKKFIQHIQEVLPGLSAEASSQEEVRTPAV
ncbi:MAG: LysR family transcriptional regulator [Lachnospiraceae bacterium]